VVVTGVIRHLVRTAPLQSQQQAQQHCTTAMASVKDLQATPGVCASPDAATKVRNWQMHVPSKLCLHPCVRHLRGESFSRPQLHLGWTGPGVHPCQLHPGQPFASCSCTADKAAAHSYPSSPCHHQPTCENPSPPAKTPVQSPPVLPPLPQPPPTHA
jgi:hypothetical protein